MIFEPNDRILLTESFRAPVGYQLDYALATTYSLDLLALLGSVLHLSLFGNSSATNDLQNGVKLLEALRRSAERLTVFCQNTRIQIPNGPHALYGLLESTVVQVSAPRGGAFHPKIWVLRFLKTGEKPLLRIIVQSRNLTRDRSWDVALGIEGTPSGRHLRCNEGLYRLVAALPDLSPVTPIAMKKKVQDLADQLYCAEWQLPEGFDEVWFYSLGFENKAWRPSDSQRIAVVSPFISASALHQIVKSTSDPVLLLSRPEELNKLEANAGRLFATCCVIRETAESDDGEDSSQEAETLHGLHAKIYVAENGPSTTVTLGSANATRAALVDAVNIEMLVQLTGKKNKIGSINEIFSQDGLGKLLEMHQPEKPAEADEEVRLAEQRLEQARLAFASAGLRISCDGKDDAWRLKLIPGAAINAEGIKSVKAWPISLRPDLAVDAMQVFLKKEISLATCALADITSFVAFEMTAPPAPAPCRFVLNLPTDGLPEDRRSALVRRIVANKEGFLKYLLFLLADMDPDGFLNDSMTNKFKDVQRWRIGQQSAFSLLEDMTRALCREPERLDSIKLLIDDLMQTEEGTQMVDEQFLQLWKVYSAALDEIRR